VAVGAPEGGKRRADDDRLDQVVPPLPSRVAALLLVDVDPDRRDDRGLTGMPAHVLLELGAGLRAGQLG